MKLTKAALYWRITSLKLSVAHDFLDELTNRLWLITVSKVHHIDSQRSFALRTQDIQREIEHEPVRDFSGELYTP